MIPCQLAGGVVRFLNQSQIEEALRNDYFNGGTEMTASRKGMELRVSHNGSHMCGYVDPTSGYARAISDVFVALDDDDEGDALENGSVRLECEHWNRWLSFGVHGGWTAWVGFDCSHSRDAVLGHRPRRRRFATFKMPCWVLEQLARFADRLPRSVTLEWLEQNSRRPVHRALRERSKEAPGPW